MLSLTYKCEVKLPCDIKSLKTFYCVDCGEIASCIAVGV